MGNIRIVSYNGKDYGIISGKIVRNGVDRPQALARFVTSNDIDVLGTQEMTKVYRDHLMAFLYNYGFNVVGDPRQMVIPFYNEINGVIARDRIISSSTRALTNRSSDFKLNATHLFNTHKRNLTYALIDTEQAGEMFVVNVHMSYLLNNPLNDTKINEFNNNMRAVRAQQFREIINMVDFLKESRSIPVVLMGDFNSTVSDDMFMQFIAALKNRGIILVSNDVSTQKDNKLPVDHMMYSEGVKLVDFRVGNELNEISDHKPLILTLKAS
ncbi:MAG: endonuclease/exonuclease/phosphatase family protein [Bacilli bacterium]|nr:endonuclease/exonuclease/phosphatase family protein [Bacilli bacterium]